MNTNLATQGFELTPALEAWVSNELDATLSRFDKDIRLVDVQLSEERGPQGGEGISAGITVFLKHRSPVRITTVYPDLYAAIAITAMRSEQNVEIALNKRRRLQRTEKRRWSFGETFAAPI